MPTRHPRYKGDEIIEAAGNSARENARVLNVIPFFTGESVSGLMGTISAMTTAHKSALRPGLQL